MPDPRATFNSNVQHTHRAALRSSKHIPTHRKLISIITKAPAAPSQVPSVVRQASSPVHLKAIMKVELAIIHRRMGNEANKRRRSRTREANLTRNARRNVAAPTDPSPIRVCTSKCHNHVRPLTSITFFTSVSGTMFHLRLTRITMTR